MSYPDILERSSVLVDKYLIYLVQDIKTLYNMPKHRVLPVEVFDAIRKCDKKLTCTTTGRLIFYGGCDSHGDSTFFRVF
jgi:hypothetical protein